MINSMGNGVMMMGDGPNVTGTWYNINTGDSFTVRDTYFEDNKLKVQTTDGRIIGYEQLQNYVQSDVPLSKDKIPVPIGDSKMSNMAKLDDLKNSNTADDNLIKGLDKASEMTRKVTQTENIERTENYTIIDKAMSKIKSEPELVIGIKWDDFPEKEITLLLDVMEIPAGELVKYCYDKFIKEKTTEKISESFENYIKSKLNL